MRRIIDRFAHHPNRLFLLDGTGACLTALVLISSAFLNWSGMPAGPLNILIVYAAFLCIFSLACALSAGEKWRTFLRIIIIANAVYCVLTGFLMSCHFASLTGWGLAYFCGEIVVILALVVLERTVLQKSRPAT
jgi:hypothetical protein